MPYLRRVYLVPPHLEDFFVADLWEAGTLGVMSNAAPDGRLRLEAWFAAEAPPWDRDDWPAQGVDFAAEELVAETDWLAAWREQAQPFPVGRTLFVDPREPDEGPGEVPEGRKLLRLPARAAFGTGSHESTSLAVELLEDLDLAGRQRARRGNRDRHSLLRSPAGRRAPGRRLRPRSGRAIPCARQQPPERPPAALLRRPGRGGARRAVLRPGVGQRRAGADPSGDARHRPPAAAGRRGDPLRDSGRARPAGSGPPARSRVSPKLAAAKPATGWPFAWSWETGSEPGHAARRSRELRREGEVRVEGEPYRHLFRARRLAVGDRVRVVDGRGQARWAAVARIDRSAAVMVLGEPAPGNEPELRLELLVPTCRPERASWLVEKATELGVASIRFLHTERAPRQLGDSTVARLQRVAAAALEQCHGSRLPEITGPHEWSELATLTGGVGERWVLDTEAETAGGGFVGSHGGSPHRPGGRMVAGRAPASRRYGMEAGRSRAAGPALGDRGHRRSGNPPPSSRQRLTCAPSLSRMTQPATLIPQRRGNRWEGCYVIPSVGKGHDIGS